MIIRTISMIIRTISIDWVKAVRVHSAIVWP